VFRLAGKLGMTAEEVMERVSATEFDYWRAYWLIETPDQDLYFGLAMLRTWIDNTFCRQRGDKRAEVADAMPQFARQGKADAAVPNPMTSYHAFRMAVPTWRRQ